jgi:hypothetical protein
LMMAKELHVTARISFLPLVLLIEFREVLTTSRLAQLENTRTVNVPLTSVVWRLSIDIRQRTRYSKSNLGILIICNLR